MAKKKNKSQADGSAIEQTIPLNPAITASTSLPKAKDAKPPQSQPSTSALIICRNKHWRYISSFHGPWLQLPPEVLESLANNNFNLPRPRPIDPAVFFDLLKVRQLVDDATNLAVRAASGVTSSSLTNAQNAGMLSNSGAALGLGIGGGGNAKLSRERKHRMREQATQKLSKAYHLDEIACSVATMQSASTLEDVAHLVLQRSPLDSDAKYVHFFHEKIPSRQLAECTSLDPLDEIIADRPYEGEILRTRAVTKIFKEDFQGAVEDLTSALKICRYYQNQHKAGRQQLQLAGGAAIDASRNSRWKEEVKLDEEEHPNSLETQLLFHRAGVHLTIACQYVNDALPPKSAQNGVNGIHAEKVTVNGATIDDRTGMTPIEKKRADSHKMVKTHAKKALKDYVSYLSHFDYTPGLPTEVTEEFVRKVNQAANGFKIPRQQHHARSLDLESNASLSNGQLSDALITHNGVHANRHRPASSSSRTPEIPSLPPPVVHQLSALFEATPPAGLPPYPETATALTTKQQLQQTETTKAFFAQNNDCHEALTYHPLLTDALHSLLLCHCLVQTSARELQRHAHMVARLARICDGYPIFQAARSPSRADWIEVVRRGDNWIELQHSWESLCAPAPLPGQMPQNQQKETPAEKKERLKQQAIMEALEDDRVHDEASFHAAVAARQRRQEEEARKAEGKEIPKRWAQEDGKEYPISTERAQAIVRWVREAPVGGELRKKKRSTKPGSGSKGKAKANTEEPLADIKVNDAQNFEPVEEEVD